MPTIQRPTTQPRTEESQRPEMDELAERDAVRARIKRSGREIKDDLDRLIDEIDAVLEENARGFVEAYVQKGGQ